MKTIGVYGSLKKGCYNHERFGLDKAKYIGATTIKGAMYLIARSYPALVYGGDPDYDLKHDLEIYEVTDHMFEVLDSMETAAGYKKQLIYLGPNGLNVDAFVWVAGSEIATGNSNYIESYPALN